MGSRDIYTHMEVDGVAPDRRMFHCKQQPFTSNLLAEAMFCSTPLLARRLCACLSSHHDQSGLTLRNRCLASRLPEEAPGVVRSQEAEVEAKVKER